MAEPSPIVPDPALDHLADIRRVYLSDSDLPSDTAPIDLRTMGFVVLCLNDIPRLDLTDIRAVMATASRLICTEADAVAVLPAWRTSTTAQAEIAIATAIGLPVIDAETLELVNTAPEPEALAACIARHPAGKGRPLTVVG